MDLNELTEFEGYTFSSQQQQLVFSIKGSCLLTGQTTVAYPKNTNLKNSVHYQRDQCIKVWLSICCA